MLNVLTLPIHLLMVFVKQVVLLEQDLLEMSVSVLLDLNTLELVFQVVLKDTMQLTRYVNLVSSHVKLVFQLLQTV